MKIKMKNAFEASAVGTPRSSTSPSAPRVAATRLVLAGVTLMAMTTLTLWGVTRPALSHLTGLAIVPPASEPVFVSPGVVDVAITPDGTATVYTGIVQGERRLFVRTLDQLEVMPLHGLGHDPANPFISPDGEWVGYIDGATAIKKVAIQGGSPVTTVCALGAATGIPRGASWGPDDTIIFATADAASGLWRVAASGGEPEALTTPDQQQGEVDHRWPEILPGGEAVVFTIIASPLENSQIAVLSLDTREQKILIQGGHNPRYSPTGHLVYGAEGRLWAVRFDLDRLETIGNGVPVLENVNSKPTGAMNFSFSKNGWLVYVGAEATSRGTLGWVNREGQMTALMETEGFWGYPRLSPDGKRVALVITRSGARDIWIRDLERGADTKLTLGGNNVFPAWTPDGTKVTFASNRHGAYDVYWKPWDGSGEAERLTTSADGSISGSWGPDSQTFVYYEMTSDAERDIWMLSPDADPSALVATKFNERAPSLSPDGHWLAYVSDREGQDQVVVQPFPTGGGVIQISTGGGTEPVWSRDGSELFYRHGNQMMVVEVEREPAFSPGRPTLLFEAPYDIDPAGQGNSNYDVSLRGDQFLMVRRSETQTAALVVVENWHEELKRLVPVD